MAGFKGGGRVLEQCNVPSLPALSLCIVLGRRRLLRAPHLIHCNDDSSEAYG